MSEKDRSSLIEALVDLDQSLHRVIREISGLTDSKPSGIPQEVIDELGRPFYHAYVADMEALRNRNRLGRKR